MVNRERKVPIIPLKMRFMAPEFSHNTIGINEIPDIVLIVALALKHKAQLLFHHTARSPGHLDVVNA
jgi:hypothetical protein